MRRVLSVARWLTPLVFGGALTGCSLLKAPPEPLTLDQRAGRTAGNSANFVDQVPLWLEGRYIEMPLREASVRARFRHVTELTP